MKSIWKITERVEKIRMSEGSYILRKAYSSSHIVNQVLQNLYTEIEAIEKKKERPAYNMQVMKLLNEYKRDKEIIGGRIDIGF